MGYARKCSQIDVLVYVVLHKGLNGVEVQRRQVICLASLGGHGELSE